MLEHVHVLVRFLCFVTVVVCVCVSVCCRAVGAIVLMLLHQLFANSLLLHICPYINRHLTLENHRF